MGLSGEKKDFSDRRNPEGTVAAMWIVGLRLLEQSRKPRAETEISGRRNLTGFDGDDGEMEFIRKSEARRKKGPLFFFSLFFVT